MVYFIEKNTKAFKTLESNLNLLNLNQYNLINQDSIKYLEKADLLPFDLIFLDPPFNKGLLPSILSLLSRKNLISTESKIFIESEYEINLEFLNSNVMNKCRIVKQKKSGNVHYCLISLEEL